MTLALSTWKGSATPAACSHPPLIWELRKAGRAHRGSPPPLHSEKRYLCVAARSGPLNAALSEIERRLQAAAHDTKAKGKARQGGGDATGSTRAAASAAASALNARAEGTGATALMAAAGTGNMALLRRLLSPPLLRALNLDEQDDDAVTVAAPPCQVRRNKETNRSQIKTAGTRKKRETGWLVPISILGAYIYITYMHTYIHFSHRYAPAPWRSGPLEGG